MKTRLLHLCIPMALTLAAGCATQSTDTGSASSATAPAPAPAPSASSSGTPSSGMRGEASGGMQAGATVRDAAGRPMKSSVYYEFDRASLSAADRKLVEAHAQYLREHPGVKVRVEGNADERGSKEYNLALGQRRAESVSRAMGLLGVNGERVEAVSYGEEKPRAGGHDEQAWSQNRRSDIVY